MRKKPKRTMTNILKAAIVESGQSRYQISQATGILQTSLSRFMRGETSLRLDKADVLAEYLGLELVRKSDAAPPEPTPENLARPMLATRKAKATRRTHTPKPK